MAARAAASSGRSSTTRRCKLLLSAFATASVTDSTSSLFGFAENWPNEGGGGSSEFSSADVAELWTTSVGLIELVRSSALERIADESCVAGERFPISHLGLRSPPDRQPEPIQKISANPKAVSNRRSLVNGFRDMDGCTKKPEQTGWE